MTKMSVARALSKLKLTKAKITGKIDFITAYGYGNSKTNSVLSKVANTVGNQNEARTQVTAAIQAYKDLLKYYRVVTLAIQKSNLETKICTEYFGEITIADAMVIVTKLTPAITNYKSALGQCVTKATESAEAFNKKSFSKTITESMDKSVADALLAQPCIFFDQKEAEDAAAMAIYIHEELNTLINESNAITMIEVPDEVK